MTPSLLISHLEVGDLPIEPGDLLRSSPEGRKRVSSSLSRRGLDRRISSPALTPKVKHNVSWDEAMNIYEARATRLLVQCSVLGRPPGGEFEQRSGESLAGDSENYWHDLFVAARDPH